jgi:hypothetical protein
MAAAGKPNEMKRRLLNLLTAVSLLLFVAVVGVWVCSYWVTLVVEHGTGQYRDEAGYTAVWRHCTVDDGTAFLAFVRPRHPTIPIGDVYPPPGWHWRAEFDQPPLSSRWPSDEKFLGFRHPTEPKQYAGTGHRVLWLAVPLWSLSLVTAAAPMFWLRRAWRRRRRLRAGLCPACGYDLRATSGRCPECGTPR